MLDKNFVRENLDFVRERLAARGGKYPLDELVAADTEWKNIILRSEELRRQRNEASEAIGKLKRAGTRHIGTTGEGEGDFRRDQDSGRRGAPGRGAAEFAAPQHPESAQQLRSRRLRRDRKSAKSADGERRRLLTSRLWIMWISGSSLGILDMDRASKITGARFSLLCNAGALMERALINFMLDVHTKYHGYQEVLPPFMANATSLFGTGNLPKFAQDLFKVEGNRLLPDTDSRSARHQYLPGMRYWMSPNCRRNLSPTRPASAVKPALMERMCAD